MTHADSGLAVSSRTAHLTFEWGSPNLPLLLDFFFSGALADVFNNRRRRRIRYDPNLVVGPGSLCVAAAAAAASKPNQRVRDLSRAITGSSVTTDLFKFLSPSSYFARASLIRALNGGRHTHARAIIKSDVLKCIKGRRKWMMAAAAAVLSDVLASGSFLTTTCGFFFF